MDRLDHWTILSVPMVWSCAVADSPWINGAENGPIPCLFEFDDPDSLAPGHRGGNADANFVADDMGNFSGSSRIMCVCVCFFQHSLRAPRA